MMSDREIKRFQEFLLNAWPAEHYFFLNGWIMRFNNGVTYRANSIFPIRYTADESQVDFDIEIAESAYKRYGLPCTFTMHESFEPDNLDNLLKKRGFIEHDPTNTLISPINQFNIQKVNKNVEYKISNERSKEFSNTLAKYTQRDKSQQKIINQIVKRIIIPKQCFIVAQKHGEILGTVMGVLIPYGYVYVADLFVISNYRRKEIATSLMGELIKNWAIPNGAKYIWLQVERENTNAMKFYEHLGMKKAYNYYYLTKDFQV
jgi:ribosomal protein S18 acetylase RimI-like enzyme